MAVVGVTAPTWEAVDSDAGDLLSLLADDGTLRTDDEWAEFVAALRFVAEGYAGRIPPNALRPLLREVVKPQRIGAFTNRAKAEGLIAWDGEWEVSDDSEGRNAGKPARVYRWIGGAR